MSNDRAFTTGIRMKRACLVNPKGNGKSASSIRRLADHIKANNLIK